MDVQLAWEGLPTGYANRWRFFNKQACPGCFDQYKNYVRYALRRTNFFTGVRWVDEPTIFAWELMNEPRYPDATPNENTTGTTPFFFGEFNAHDNKSEWWRQLYGELETSGGDGDAYWWYPSRTGCGGFDSGEGCPELAVFRDHSARMRAKSGITTPTASPTTSPSPSASPSPSGSASPSASPNSSAGRVAYTVDSSWPGGFTASVKLTNAGTTPVSGWTLTWTAAPGQGLVNGWNATVSQSGSTVTARAPGWAQPIAPGGAWTVGYQGSGPASPAPTGFRLDGSLCTT